MAALCCLLLVGPAGCSGIGGRYPGAGNNVAEPQPDALAFNWSINESKLADDRYMLQLRMNRIHSGGDGEARLVFNRRAAQLAHDKGYGGYQVLSYSEGIDSTLLMAQRVSEGVVLLVAGH